MAIEHMSVVNAGKGFVHLRSRNPEHCEHCAASSGCGIQLLNKAMSREAGTIAVEVPVSKQNNIQAGDEVVVAIDDFKLICMSMLQYVVPILLLVASTAVAQIIITNYHINEIWVILAAFIALSGGMLLVRYLSVPLMTSAGKMFKTDCADVTYKPIIQLSKRSGLDNDVKE